MTAKTVTGAAIAGLLWYWGSSPALALIFFDTADAAHNREVAPEGVLADSGWQYQGYYKSFLGTMISPRHLVTAQHFGAGASQFIHKRFFSGEGQDRAYFINPTVNGGVGHWNIAGTDLRIFEVWDEFPGYASLYTSSDEAGKEAVLIGRGRTRGEAVTMAGETRGWRWGTDDRRARWGVNDIDSIVASESAGELLVTDFDAAPGTDECHAAAGDSGGAVFVRDGALWKLAGILYAVDGLYDTNSTCGDSSEFHAALFDASGFFVGEDTTECDGWGEVSVVNDEDESRTYASRISSSADAIEAIIGPAIIDASRSPLERFEAWMDSFGLTSELLPGDDADGDRTPNAVEYLAALDPGGVDAPKRAFEVLESGDRIRFEVRVRMDAVARGLGWEIRESGDLSAGIYVPVVGLVQVEVTALPTEGVEVFGFEIDRPSGPRRFYRLEVALAP